MAFRFDRLKIFFARDLWEIDPDSLPRFKAFLIKSLRLIHIVIREFSEEELALRARSLVYITLLSCIPLVAISFSLLKVFGINNQMEPFIYNFFAPIGPKGREITGMIVKFVENMRAEVVGSFGLVVLIYTVISLIQKVEEAFNYIWKVNKPRSFRRKFEGYISAVLIGPVLVFATVGFITSAINTLVKGKSVSAKLLRIFLPLGSKVIPYLLVCAAFTSVYFFIPNKRIKFRSALIGGILGGILWEIAGWGFASFVVSSTRYDAIYSGFAIPIIFMIWLYLSWLILLVGAKISFYHQYPQILRIKKGFLISSNRFKEGLSLLVLFLIGYNYYHNKPYFTLDSLIEYLGFPLKPLQDALELLEKKGFIIKTGDEPGSYLPAKDLEKIALKEVFKSVRGEDGSLMEGGFLSVPEIEEIMRRIDRAIEETMGDTTLKDLILLSTR